MSLTKEQYELLQVAFRPHAPIEDPAGFIGREEERARVTEALRSPGLQCVVYGERGCGKTSLANVATDGFTRIQVFCEENASFSGLCRDIAVGYARRNPARARYDATTNTITVDGAVIQAGSMSGNELLAVLPDTPICVVLDELDRVIDRNAVRLLAELAKNVSTYKTSTKFVFVGVADTADQLLDGHASNFRNLRQVSLARMNTSELRGIVHHGEKVLGITFSKPVLDRLVDLCDRMPYYLHLLATATAEAAMQRGASTAELEDLRAGTIKAAKDADQTLREVYEHAVLSPKGSKIYRRIIWAMAEADQVSLNVGAISVATNSIAVAEGDKAVTPQAVGQALRKLQAEERGSILESRMVGVVRFREPLMKGFVRVARHINSQ